MIRVSNIKIGIEKVSTEDQERQALQDAIVLKLGINEKDLVGFDIFKKSIDARKKEQILFVYTVDASIRNEKRVLGKHRSRDINPTPEICYSSVKPGTDKMSGRPVVIGMGPAGLFAALLLSRNGYRPIILERGEDVDARTAKINRFWNDGLLDTESNVQFGEGGAGTFSDGKLTTLINDNRCRIVLEEFVKAGAPKEMLYKSKPHIGTDLLKVTVKNIRQQIIANGGEVRFKAKVTDFIIREGKLEAVIINGSERLQCSVALLGIGHSARDTFEVLHQRGIAISQKPFSIGVRIEHPQHIVDKAQYGASA
jgi:uncharacterized FAD-dependent dehydrogenase